MTPVMDGDRLTLRPRATCNPERYAAWQAGTMDDPTRLPAPCAQCGETTAGKITPNGAHLMLSCGRCGAYVKFLGKKHLGLARRSTRSRPEIAPSQRTRVILRDGRRCWECGRTADRVTLQVGRILSVNDGERQGVPDELLHSDANLITQCEECNLGLGKASLPLWLVVGLLRAHRHNQGAEADA